MTRGKLEIIADVRRFVTEHFLFGDGSRLQNETQLLESGIIDSTGVLDIVEFLETTYSFHIHDQELVPLNLNSIVNLAEFVCRRTQTRDTTAQQT
jgi:acyl carrier protein